MFNITVPTPTAEKAFDMLTNQIRALNWFKQNNRMYRWEYYQKLNNPIINQMIEDRNIEKAVFYSKYQKLFVENLYKEDLYEDKIVEIKKAILELKPCYKKYENLQKSWGFEILKEYQVDVNLYGCGGSYHKDKQGVGHIIIGQTKNLAFTIGHEIMHLGIEDLIINPKHQKEPPVKQEEKERIVDNLCIYAMKGILPLEKIWRNGKESDYQEVTACASYMDKVVGKQPENNLVLAVQQFLEKGKTDLNHA